MPHIQRVKLFLTDHQTMKRYCIGGLKRSTQKSKKKSLRKKFTRRHPIYRPDELPPKVDLRPWMTTIEDQSNINAWYVLKNVLDDINSSTCNETQKNHQILHKYPEQLTK
jgi:hypothetical protein